MSTGRTGRTCPGQVPTTTETWTTCGEPITDAYACASCANLLALRLADVDELVDCLNDALALRTRRGLWLPEYVRISGAEQPLRVNLAAGDLADQLHTRIVATVRALAEHGTTYDGPTDTPHAAAWLAVHVTDLTGFDADGTLYLDLHHALLRCWRCIDRQPDSIYLGPCMTGTCSDDVYAAPGTQHGVCEGCGSSHDVAYRRRWLWQQAADLLATENLICLASDTVWGEHLTPRRFAVWRTRGRIHPRPCADGHDRYRLGDVTTLIAAAALAATEKRQRKNRGAA